MNITLTRANTEVPDLIPVGSNFPISVMFFLQSVTLKVILFPDRGAMPVLSSLPDRTHSHGEVGMVVGQLWWLSSPRQSAAWTE